MSQRTLDGMFGGLRWYWLILFQSLRLSIVQKVRPRTDTSGKAFSKSARMFSTEIAGWAVIAVYVLLIAVVTDLITFPRST